MASLSMGEVQNDFCLYFFQPSLENIDRSNFNGGCRKAFPIFHNPRQKGCTPTPAMLTLKCLLVMASKALSNGWEEKQVLLHVQKTQKYLECGY